MSILNLNSQINKKENEISEKDMEINNLNNKINDKLRIISENNTEISNLKLKANDDENKIESLTEILDAKDKIISENKEVMMKLNGIINDKDDELKNKQDKVKKLESQISERDIIIKENEKKFMELESASSSQLNLNEIEKEEKSSIVEDNDSLYEYKLENDRLMVEMEKMKSEFEKIQRLNEQLKLEKAEKENEYDQIKNNYQMLQEERDNLIKDLKENDSSNKDKKIEILMKENNDIRNKLDFAEDQIVRLTHDNKEAEILAVRANDEISRLNKIINNNQEVKFYDSGLESIDSDKTESVNNDSIIESPIIKAKSVVNVGVQCNIEKKQTLRKILDDKYSGSDKWSKLATPKHKPHTMLSSYQQSLNRRRSFSPIPCSSPTPSNTSSCSSINERPPWRLWSLYSKKN